MEDDLTATNDRQPSPEQGYGTQALKTKKEDSEDAAKPVDIQFNGHYNVRCMTCNRFLAINLQYRKRADEVLDQHQDGTECDEAMIELVKPIEPRGDE